jgi:hypothetical protein
VYKVLGNGEKWKWKWKWKEVEEWNGVEWRREVEGVEGGEVSMGFPWRTL